MRMEYDVVVVGSGNAALSAAISARERGANVLVLEKAPQVGGDSRASDGAFRFTYDGPEEVFKLLGEMTKEERETAVMVPSRYGKGDFYKDWIEVTRGRADPELVEIVVSKSNENVWWLHGLGVEYEFYTDLARRAEGKLYLPPGLPTRARGGGEGLIKYELNAAEKKGVKILCSTKATNLLLDEMGALVGVKALGKEGFMEIRSKAVILASGGFQANVEMRTKYIGPAWATAKVRGTKDNTGDGLRMAFEIGAKAFGHYSGCHCSLIDANAPDYESKMDSARYSYPFGILADEKCGRFLDEGEDVWTKTYAKLGKLTLEHLSGVSYQIFDLKIEDLIPPVYEKYMPLVRANSIGELADKLGLDPKALKETITEFNKAVRPGEFNPGILDKKCTEGIDPPKSNWAVTIEKPSFIACPVTGGITFTFGGLKINKNAQVLNNEGEVIKGLYACGEIVGGLFYYNYCGGSGLIAGATFGRIAGANAAEGI